ncbi:MAG: ABC transporter permease, partial [Bacteroidota bacterium]
MQNAIRRTIRTVTKNKVFSIINILGLAISLAIFLLMLLYLEQEWSYDRFHEKADRIYRLVDDKQTPKATLRNASTAMPVAPALLEDFPEIEAAVRILPTEMLFKKEELLFQENSVFFADANFFDVFDFEFLAGDALMSLSSINSIVLTKSSAEKYFGNSSPLGETLIADGRLLTVKGVVEDVPENAHFTFDFLISMENAKQKGSGYDWLFTNWYSGQCYTYLLLPKNYKATQLEDKLTAFDERHDEVNDKTIHHYALEALTDIYLYSDRENQIGKTGNAANLYILSLTALFILLIAGVNYVNLSTAQSTKRVLEVGIKKVLGAKPQQLFLQFISESFFVTALALVLALTLVLVSLPFISALVGSDLSQNLYTLPHFSVLLGLYSTMSFLAGIYPSSMLASYSTTKVLKEKTVFSTGNFGVKKGLVILQFSISIILMISSLVVYHQLRFMQNAKLGFDLVQTLVIDFNGDRKIQEKSTIIKRELLNIPGVKNITASSKVPGREKPSGWSMRFLSPTGDTLKTEV